MAKVFDRTVSAGIAHKPLSKSADKQLTELLHMLGGKVECITDKGAVLDFKTQRDADIWSERARKLGASPEPMED